MRRPLIILSIFFFFNSNLVAMEKKPYHHVYENGKFKEFRNLPADVPKWGKRKWPYFKWTKLKKEIDTFVPDEFLVSKDEILENIKKLDKTSSIQWLGHNGWLFRNLKGKNVLFDPVLGGTIGPMSIFGSKRFTSIPLNVDELPKIDILIISHHHFDHRDYFTLKNIKNKKDIEVFAPLRSKSFYKSLGYEKIYELDWDESKTIGDLKFTAKTSYHWSKTGLFDRNKTLWSSYLLEWDGNKAWLGGDSGYIKKIFDNVGDKIGGISFAILGIAAYDFKKLGFNETYMHTTPSQALEMGKSLKANKVIGSHFLTFVLSLEKVLDPPRLLKENAEKYGYKKDDAIIFKIGEVKDLKELTN